VTTNQAFKDWLLVPKLCKAFYRLVGKYFSIKDERFQIYGYFTNSKQSNDSLQEWYVSGNQAYKGEIEYRKGKIHQMKLIF